MAILLVIGIMDLRIVGGRIIDPGRYDGPGDIRVVDGVHPDRDEATGLPLLFKPQTIPPSARIVLH